MAELKAIEAAIISANAHHFPRSRSYQTPDQSYKPSCELIWTKAHVGTEGNERADIYAKEATTRENVDFHIGLSIKHIKTEFAKAIKTEWQLQWSSSSKGRAVHEICRHVCSQRIHGNYFLNQIITEHGALASYQHKFSTPVQYAAVVRR
ncbi:RNase H domain-containing protein [Caerostris extrusa]|uniref:RNase H domain-containing protein n=1 Tax=Caerostris extrusa TaxID=172846 RepID=A0AAV4RM44_CAEEX|nr:RNase H domain-containing protein [Caerostris extrusa]